MIIAVAPKEVIAKNTASAINLHANSVSQAVNAKVNVHQKYVLATHLTENVIQTYALNAKTMIVIQYQDVLIEVAKNVKNLSLRFRSLL